MQILASVNLGWGLRLTISKTLPSVAGAAGVRPHFEEQGSRTKGTFYISHDYIKLHKTLNPENPFPYLSGNRYCRPVFSQSLLCPVSQEWCFFKMVNVFVFFNDILSILNMNKWNIYYLVSNCHLYLWILMLSKMLTVRLSMLEELWEFSNTCPSLTYLLRTWFVTHTVLGT